MMPWGPDFPVRMGFAPTVVRARYEVFDYQWKSSRPRPSARRKTEATATTRYAPAVGTNA